MAYKNKPSNVSNPPSNSEQQTGRENIFLHPKRVPNRLATISRDLFSHDGQCVILYLRRLRTGDWRALGGRVAGYLNNPCTRASCVPQPRSHSNLFLGTERRSIRISGVASFGISNGLVSLVHLGWHVDELEERGRLEWELDSRANGTSSWGCFCLVSESANGMDRMCRARVIKDGARVWR